MAPYFASGARRERAKCSTLDGLAVGERRAMRGNADTERSVGAK